MTLFHSIVIFGSAALAGMINSVAGGGTLLTFPILIWLGQSPIVANATSTAALWPGSAGGMWGYREELRRSTPRLFWLMIPSVLGGIAGAVLLKQTPPGVFARLVPFLILFATLLFMAQSAVQRWIRVSESQPSSVTPGWLVGAGLFQFAVAIYGGYFGAGIGILMLTALALLGLTDIHQMNGLKTLFAMCINGLAAAYFMLSGLIEWNVAGGYGGRGDRGRIRRRGNGSEARFSECASHRDRDRLCDDSLAIPEAEIGCRYLFLCIWAENSAKNNKIAAERYTQARIMMIVAIDP